MKENKIIIDSIKSLQNSTLEFDDDTANVILPILYSEDDNRNINFDIEGMRELFEELMSVLEKHNDENDFNWELDFKLV